MKTLDHLYQLDTLLEQLCLLGRRPQGLVTLGQGILRFLTWCRQAEYDPADLTRGELKTYRHTLVDQGLCGKSVNLLLWAATRYLDHLVKQGLRSDQPGKGLVTQAKGTTLPRHLLKETEVDKVLEHLSRYDQAPSLRRRQEVYRTHVLAEVLYASGLRIAEAAHLTPEDLDLPHRQLRVREGKGGRERTAFLSDYAAGVLDGFLRVRPFILQAGFGSPERVFGMQEGNLSHAFSRELGKVCEELHLGAVTAHCLRHMVGWHLLRKGASLRSIQGILGHARLRSTEIYTYVDKESLKAVLDNFHPRSPGRTTDEVGAQPRQGTESEDHNVIPDLEDRLFDLPGTPEGPTVLLPDLGPAKDSLESLWPLVGHHDDQRRTTAQRSASI